MSPLSASPCRERHSGFFDLLSRRFGRRSHDELYFHNNGEDDSRSSSTDSCSSTSGRMHANDINKSHKQMDLLKVSSAKYNCGYEFGNTSESNCSSDSNSDSVENTNDLQIHRRSSSTIRRALQNLSISSRSLSCSSTPSKDQKMKKAKKTPPPPKRILRQPVSYTYLKGMSGLPTQRVPRSSVCCHYTHR